jgi:hypothetical protein
MYPPNGITQVIPELPNLFEQFEENKNDEGVSPKFVLIDVASKWDYKVIPLSAFTHRSFRLIGVSNKKSTKKLSLLKTATVKKLS